MSETLIPRRVLFGNPERTHPRLSPDGRLLAYLAPDPEGVLNVWVRTLGEQDERLVTHDDKRGVHFFTWQYDSRHVLYIQDREGDENWHLYQTALDGEETRDLTPFEGVQAQWLAYEPQYPDQVLVGLNRRDARLHDVYRLDLSSAGLTLLEENPGDVTAWSADHTLRVRASAATLPDGGTEVRVRREEDGWEKLLSWGPDETFGRVVGFSADNRRLLLVASLEGDTARLLEVDLADRSRRCLAADDDYDIAGVLIHPTRHHPEAVSIMRARRQWRPLVAEMEEQFEAIGRINPGDFEIESRDLEDQQWIVSFVNDNAPTAFHLYDLRRRNSTFLFHNRPQLERYTLCSMRPVSFASRDGLPLHGYLTLPRGRSTPLPLVLNVHGGPWVRDVWTLDNETQWLANRGYAVLQVNYRGSTGYGKAFLNAGDRQWGAAMHDDLVDAKRWAVAEGIADAERVAIYGGSYGGYAVLVGLAFTPEEFACGVDIVGPSNLVTLIRSIPPYWTPLRSIFDKRVGSLEREEEFLKSRSPLFRAASIRRPLLIAQGKNDPRVRQAESDQIVAEMRRNGLEVEYLLFADEGHGFVRPQNRLRFYAAAEAFLARHLGGAAEPPAPQEDWTPYRR